VKTRRGAGHDSDSDDDAPEEVQLTSAKAQAQESRKQQLEQQKAQQEAAKKKRQAQEAKRTEQKQQAQQRKRKSAPADEEKEQQEEPQPSGRQPDGGDGYALGAADADLLPTSVLEALQQEDSKQTQAASSPAGQRAAQAQAAAERKRKRIEQLKKGPVVVQVLKAVKKMASGTASTFLQDQLYGNRLKRSGEMLQPVGAAAVRTPGGVVLGPARKFA